LTLGELLRKKIELDREIRRAQILEELAKITVCHRWAWRREELAQKLRRV